MVGPIARAPLLFLDTETGGLDPSSFDLLEVAAILTDPSGQTVHDSLSLRVKYDRPVRIAAEAQRVNGWNEIVWNAEGSTLDETIARLSLLARDAVMVAHNVAFDWSFIDTAFRECKREWPGRYHRVDTAALSWPLLAMGQVDNVKLATMIQHIGLTQVGAHSAAGDAEDCRRLYAHLMSMYKDALMAEGVLL